MPLFKIKQVKSFFQRLFQDIKDHPVPFIISLLLSIMLFYYITNIGIQSLLTVGDLQYRLNSDDLFINNKSNIKVKITLRGKPDDLKLVNEDIIKTFIDINASKPGDYIFKVQVDKAYLPDNVKVVKIDPSTVKVSLDKILKKKVKLEPNITGKCESGFSISQISFTKSPYIIVEGPYTLLSGIDVVKTSEISVDGLNFSVVLPVKLQNESLKIISPNDNQIVIDIRPINILKTIENIPILLSNKNSKFNYTLSVNKFNAQILVSEDTLATLSSSDLIFIIDCSYFQSPGFYNIKIIPKTNSSINIIDTNPQYIQLTVTLSIQVD